MDLRLRADIHTARRLIDDEHTAFAGQPFGERDLLLIAAAQAGDDGFERGRFHAQAFRVTAHQRLLGATADEAEARELEERGERTVLAAIHAEHEAEALAILGQKAKSGGERGVNVARRKLLSTHDDPARRASVETEHRLRHFAATRADETGEAEHFASAQGEGDVLELAGGGKILHAQQFLARLFLQMSGRHGYDVAPDHLVDDALRVRLRDGFGGDVPAIAQHGDGVAQAEDFLHAMRDVEDGDAALLELGDELEEMFALGNRQRAGRLIHDDDAGVHADSGGDLHELLLAGAQLADGPIHVEVGFNFAEHGAGAGAHGTAIQPAGARRQGAEAQVFGDGEVGTERQFLMHHCDAEPAGVERV